MTDDQGYGVSGTFGGVIPTPALDRIAKAGLRYTQFHSTALCSPTRAALITGRNHHSVGFGVITELSTGYPGYDSIIGTDKATIGTILQRQRLCDLVVRQEPQHAGLPVQRRRAVRPMAVGHGLRLLLRLHGRRDRPVDALPVPRITPQIFPWVGKPGYNLITDMADEAIKLHEAARMPRRPRSRSSSTTCPAARTRRTSRRKEWIDKFKGKFDMGWNVLREQIFANQKRLGVIPANAQLTPWPDEPAEVGHAVGRREEALRPPGRGLRRLRGLHRPRDRPRDPAGRGHGQARQHADHLHQRRQRHQPRRHDCRHAQPV